MFQSNSRYYLKSTISASATAGSTFLISPDFELGEDLETGSDTVSFVLKNATQIERFEITATGGTATIVKRGLDQSSSKVQITALKKQWSEGTVCYVAALASDLLDMDKSSGTSTVVSDTDFSGYARFTGTMRLPVFADETERDAAYTSPVNGDKCLISGVGEQNYEGGAWHTMDLGTPTPNASATVAGKVETATDAQVAASTDTGETGALLHVLPSQAGKIVSLAGAETAIAEDDHLVFSDTDASGVNKRITKANARETMAASTTLKGTVEMATNAEALAGTDEERYVNAKQMKDSYGQFKHGVFARAANATSNVQTIAHGLGRIPKFVEFSADYVLASNGDVDAHSRGSYDGTSTSCTYWANQNGTGVTGNSTSNAIVISTTGPVSHVAVATFDATNITLTWTSTAGTAGNNVQVLWKAR